MVFARAKLVLEDNCFIEEPGGVEMKFVGPHVTNLYNKMYETMKSVLHVSDADIQETDYKWGKGAKGEKFKIRWWVHKDMDLFTYLYIRFDLSGEVIGRGIPDFCVCRDNRSDVHLARVHRRGYPHQYLSWTPGGMCGGDCRHRRDPKQGIGFPVA